MEYKNEQMLVSNKINEGAEKDWSATVLSQKPNSQISWSDIEKIRTGNTALAKELFEKYGWPKISIFGKKTVHWFWYMVQHSDKDVEFQKKCLNAMKNLSDNEVDLYDLAHLTDRVQVNTGQPQLYGTQLYKNKEGDIVPRTIENLDQLEQRRNKMGLDIPFEVHHRSMLSD